MQGNNFDGRLSWTAGGFYFDRAPRDDFDLLNLQILYSPSGNGTQLNIISHNTKKSKALFWQGTYEIVQDLKFTAGVRYTWDERSQESASGSDPACANGPDTNCVFNVLASKSKALTWTLGLDYQVTPDTLIYLASRRGYRGGGTNGAPSNLPFDPEFVTDAELGIKSDWAVMTVPVRTNLALFYQNYNDIQVTAHVSTPYPGYPAGIDVTQNASKARIMGAELETQAQLTRNLQVSAYFSILDFKYTEFGEGVNPNLYLGAPKAGRVPRKMGLSGVYDLPIPDQAGELSLRANYSWQDERLDFTGVPIPAINVALNWDKIWSSRIDASVFASNLADKTYPSGGVSFLGMIERPYGEPRMYGLRVRYRFGAEQ